MHPLKKRNKQADEHPALRQIVGDQVALFPVVKANAYGHGAIPVAHAALDAGCTGLCVARLDEGIALQVSAPPSGFWAGFRLNRLGQR